MAVTISKHRTHIGKIILISSIILVVSLFTLYILGAFRPDEFEELCKLLSPIYALYVGAVIKHVISNPSKKIQKETIKPEVELEEIYVFTSKFAVYTHLISVLTLIWLFGLFSFIRFKDFTSLIVGIEVLFGIYAGWFLTHLFGTENQKN